ncbi:hypothetical protein OSCT_1041 [Oscillochloris trichoides DG-6]|uniref:Uncharacterized protein n=1 Tax=Oscillochloris trichoides DG-6 TaxID=765420 RepID=E1ICJ0_9CHLR|nr:hypothetical protein [Oscillochloris trichoides]EFO81118.1 hypothetical protein OSCT_1041 [Oscillochloris trichoides DG-6]
MHSARSPFTLELLGMPNDPITALDLALSTALSVGGLGHVALTPFYYGHETGINQAWFAGSGLALTLVGMLNILRLRGDATAGVMSKAANLGATSFLGFAALQNREAQTIAGFALAATLTTLAMRK